MAPGRSIFDQAPNGLAILDGAGRIRTANAAFERLVDMTCAELAGRDLGSLFAGEQADAVEALVAGIVADGNRVRAEALLSTRAGSTRLITFVLTRLDQGGDGEVLVTAEDVTEDRRATIRVAHDQKLEELGRLAAGIAHEIRSPLQYVITSLEYLESALAGLVEGRDTLDDVGAELREALADVTEGVGRINEISQGMNVLAHRAPAEVQSCDIRETLGFPLAVARGLAPAGTEIVSHLSDDLPTAPLRVGEVQQALLNVLVNAIHAIEDRRADQPRHTGRIEVLGDHDDDCVRLTVVDDGVGMDAITKAQATDAFFTTKAEGRGTGQGLSLVREVIDGHGGTLTITSVPGEGTTVSLRFPLATSQVRSTQAD